MNSVDSHMYIAPGIDAQKTYDDARHKSKGDWFSKPSVVQVHAHSKKEDCADQPHTLFVNGEEQNDEQAD